SWRILLADLAALVPQIASSARPDLGEPSTPFHEWATKLEAWARSAEWDAELAPWLDQTTRSGADAADLVRLLGRPGSSGSNRVADEQVIRFALDEAATRRAVESSGRLVKAPVDRALIAALVESLGAHRAWWIDADSHGRCLDLSGVDVSRTVGWFTSIFPVHVDAACGTSTIE